MAEVRNSPRQLYARRAWSLPLSSRVSVAVRAAMFRSERLGAMFVRSSTNTTVGRFTGSVKPASRFGGPARMKYAGAAMLQPVIDCVDSSVELLDVHSDGSALSPGQTVARWAGPMRSILAIERTALNFMTHLSGIATLTSRFVDAVSDTSARIYDTRKTIPGLRGLAKYAVACGGGHNHRMGLHDAVLIKDNHLAAMGGDWLDALARAINSARDLEPAPTFIEVEVDTLDQLRQVLDLKPDMVLLDNMSLDALRSAVAMRNDLQPSVELEASGGVTLETVAGIAATGVDRISVGALTHSAPALDLGLDLS